MLQSGPKKTTGLFSSLHQIYLPVVGILSAAQRAIKFALKSLLKIPPHFAESESSTSQNLGYFLDIT